MNKYTKREIAEYIYLSGLFVGVVGMLLAIIGAVGLFMVAFYNCPLLLLPCGVLGAWFWAANEVDR